MKKFNCDSCGKETRPGEFMAVLAKSHKRLCWKDRCDYQRMG